MDIIWKLVSGRRRRRSKNSQSNFQSLRIFSLSSCAATNKHLKQLQFTIKSIVQNSFKS